MIKKITQKKIGNFSKTKIAIVKSLYHEEINNRMVTSCKETLIKNGVKEKNIFVFNAPGSWEIPLIVDAAASTEKYDGIAAFGVIIKGETYHFEMIANEVSSGLMKISLHYLVPVALEVLAVFKKSQAEERTKGKYNKGAEAANALLASIQTLKNI